MELLSSIATAIGALLGLAAAAVNLVSVSRSRIRCTTACAQHTRRQRSRRSGR